MQLGLHSRPPLSAFFAGEMSPARRILRSPGTGRQVSVGHCRLTIPPRSARRLSPADANDQEGTHIQIPRGQASWVCRKHCRFTPLSYLRSAERRACMSAPMSHSARKSPPGARGVCALEQFVVAPAESG